MLAEVDPKRPKLPEDVQEQVNINIKYDGYIKRQMKQVEQFKKMEEKKIPENINYDEIQSLAHRGETEAEPVPSDQHRPGITYFGRFPGGYFGSAGVSGT